MTIDSSESPLSSVVRALRAVAGGPTTHPEQWTELRRVISQTANEQFDYAAALTAHLGLTTVAVRSVPSRRINLYADLVIRHLDHQCAAIHRRSRRWVEISFRELHEETARLATLWARAGMGYGARIALAIPPGPLLWVAVLACMRLGATAVLFPPGVGRGFVDRRLSASPPDAIAVDTDHWRAGDCESFAEHCGLIPARAPTGVVANLGGRSHGYEPDDPVVAVYGGFAPEPEQSVILSASTLWTRLATDAALILPVHPGAKVAALGMEPTRHPLLFATVLFGGGTWVEASIEALIEDPLRLDVVGVGVACRDAVLRDGLVPRGWNSWFKDPSEPYEWQAWRNFESILRAATANPVGQNLVFSSALGGTVLFSPPLPTVDLDVVPSPGLDWVLEEPAAPGQVTEARAGVLAVREGAQPAEATGRIVLSDPGVAYLYSGSLLQGRNATALPVRELSALLRSHPVVDDAVILSGPSGALLNGVSVTAVVFVDPARDPGPVAPLITETLNELIRRQMGEAYLPDRIVAVPLTPRRVDGAVDAEWCRFQLQTGGLAKMANSEVHRLTSLLRRWGLSRVDEAQGETASDHSAKGAS